VPDFEELIMNTGLKYWIKSLRLKSARQH
jgi:hypothetical protein